MKIMLIVPTIHREGVKRISPFWLPPLSLATIAGLTPEEHEVKIIDENVEDIDFEDPVDIVAISCLTSQSTKAYKIADKFRNRKICVVIGGYHPSACPEECLEHADAVIIGEAENNWEELLEDFKNGKLKSLYKKENFPSLENIPFPKRNLYQTDKYLSTNTIQTSKGCPFVCEFCNISTFFGRKYRTKPIEQIVEEIKTMKKKDGDLFFFVDDEITADNRRAKELFKALIPLNIRWWSQATLKNLTSDKELLDLAVESGCIIIVAGLESISEQNLKIIGKFQNNTNMYEEQIAMIQEKGIMLNPSFTFGNDGDDITVFDQTLDFIYKNKIALATFNILTPLPSTRLYSRLIQENRILIDDWSKYDMGHCVFQPKNMTKEELEEGFNRIGKEFYSIESIKKRLEFVGKDKKQLIFGWNLGYKRLLDTFGVLM